jgi:ACS family hexuronate transporter-like MFS transporter
MFAWLPFLFGDVGSVSGGWIAGRLIRAGMGVRAARLATMFFGAACCLLSLEVARSPSAAAAIGLICVIVFGHTFLSANMFASITDLFSAGAVGRVTGLTGIAGGVSGLIFPVVTGILVDRLSYTPVFTIAAFMPMAGVAVLALIAGGFRKIERA